MCCGNVDIEATKKEVEDFLDRYLRATENKDLETLKTLIAQDDNMVSFGTDEDERVVGYEKLINVYEKFFKSLNSLKITVRDQIVNVAQWGNVAWYSFLSRYEAVIEEQSMTVDAMGTGVAEKRDGQWVMVQSHLSVPIKGRAIDY